MSRTAVVAAALLAAAALTGCGRLGALEQPAPLFGAQAKADYAARQRAAADARARAKVSHDQPDDADALSDGPPMAKAPFATPIPGGPGGGGGGSPPEGALPTPGVTPDR